MLPKLEHTGIINSSITTLRYSSKLIILALLAITLTACGGGSSSGSDIGDNTDTDAASLSMTANPDQVNPGQTSTITWLAQNSVSCRADGSSWTSSIETGGSQSVGPMTKTTVFTMLCLSKEGGPITESITIVVNDPNNQPAPSLTISASPNQIIENQTTSISWSTTDATSCSAVGGWSNKTSAVDSQIVGPLTDTTRYRMTCTGPGGSITRSTTVTVNPMPSTPVAPALTLTSSPNTIEENETSVITWNASNATSCSAIGGWSNKTSVSDNQTVGPLTTTTTYRMRCTGTGGTVTETVTITVTQPSLGSVELSWDAPTTNEDGSVLTDLAGYTIYYGTNQSNLNQIIDISNVGITSFVISDLPSDTYYFSITAKDNNNNESTRSNIASKVLN